MEKPHLLHLITSAPNASPFDVNMAYDAGYAGVMPYVNVTLDQVEALVQDAIFSRGPRGVKRTGVFIGGREPGVASDMLDVARKSMVPPFEVSVFADPSGAYTTAAAMVAVVEKALAQRGASFQGARVLVMGGTGPVGTSAAVLAARSGAQVTITTHHSVERALMIAENYNARYGVDVRAALADSDEHKIPLVEGADVILATAKAGIQVLGAKVLAHASALRVAADVNAVPPAGIEGVDVQAGGTPVEAGSGQAVGIGALAVGNVKYQVQNAMFRAMIEADSPVYLDLPEAFDHARRAVS